MRKCQISSGIARVWIHALRVLLAGAAFVALTGLAAEAASRRVALVIGNAAYKTLPELANSVNDSAKVRDTLREAGFETFYGANLTRLETEAMIQKFFRAVDGSDIAIVYYSGHGVQVAGDNFIVPVDTKLATPYDIEQQTIKVADIFNYVSTHSRAQLIFLDACRNNPFKIDRFWIGDTLKVADSTTGLARANYGVGSLIAFSTEPGAVAYDGLGALSPYTSALVHHITAPNEEIRHALTQVRREVIAATDGRQVPWENSALVDDVYLMPAPPGPSVQPMVRISIPPRDGPTPIHIPAPRRASDDGLAIRIEQAPDQGKLTLGGKPLDPAQALSVADLDHLAYDATGLTRGAIGLVSYVVTDKWAQSARGMIAITLDAAAPPAQAPARDPAVAAAETLRRLDRREAQAPIGVGPAPLGLDAPVDGTAEAPAVMKPPRRWAC